MPGFGLVWPGTRQRRPLAGADLFVSLSHLPAGRYTVGRTAMPCRHRGSATDAEARQAPVQARSDRAAPARTRGAQREGTRGRTSNPGTAPNAEARARGRGCDPANRGARAVLLSDKAMWSRLRGGWGRRQSEQRPSLSGGGGRSPRQSAVPGLPQGSRHAGQGCAAPCPGPSCRPDWRQQSESGRGGRAPEIPSPPCPCYAPLPTDGTGRIALRVGTFHPLSL